MQDLQNVVDSKKSKSLTIAELCQSPKYTSRYAEVLGSQEKANQFLASLIAISNTNTTLQKCDPMAVMGCAMMAASLNLDINPNLGFAYVIPYKKNVLVNKVWKEVYIPQFQMGYKGYIQLAMRSGQYRSMNVIEVYEDEFGGYDVLRNKLTFKQQTNGQRSKGQDDKIVGYAFYYELINGFEKTVYMTKQEVENHADTFSKAYQYDKKEKKNSSPWTTQFHSMAMKTVLSLTLRKFGILSTQMLNAIKFDQSTTDNIDLKNTKYVDVDSNTDIPEVEAEVKTIPEEIKETNKEIAQEVINKRIEESNIANETGKEELEF